MFTSDYKEQPWWWDRTPPPARTEQTLPERADILVIGAGYTGLHAAIQTARGGRDTVVMDAEHAGWGASSRNGGQISRSVKPDFESLSHKHDRETVFAIHREGENSIQYTEDFIGREGISCDFGRVGRFHAAHNPARFRRLVQRVEKPVPGLEDGSYIIPKSEQHSELGTDLYFGGAVSPNNACLDPAAYHRGVLTTALTAGVKVISHCPALDIRREASGFTVKTARGLIQANRVVIATNGYTGALTPWHRRRVIPIGSYIIATEPLDKAVMDRLMPTNRVISDTRKVVYYYRPSPDRRRIIFGGRVSIGETNARLSAPRLHKSLTAIFPELSAVRISHSWMGFVAYSFDELMHIGENDGLHYAMGYCGSGVGMSGYLGMRVGQQVLGLKEGRTAFDNLPFQTRPFYSGKPWFLAPSLLYYKLMDSLNI